MEIPNLYFLFWSASVTVFADFVISPCFIRAVAPSVPSRIEPDLGIPWMLSADSFSTPTTMMFSFASKHTAKYIYPMRRESIFTDVARVIDRGKRVRSNTGFRLVSGIGSTTSFDRLIKPVGNFFTDPSGFHGRPVSGLGSRTSFVWRSVGMHGPRTRSVWRSVGIVGNVSGRNHCQVVFQEKISIESDNNLTTRPFMLDYIAHFVTVATVFPALYLFHVDKVTRRE